MQAMNSLDLQGIRITRIDRFSPAYLAGLRKNCIILSVNGEQIEDNLDFNFYSANEKLVIKAQKNNMTKKFHVIRRPGEFLGLEFAKQPIRRCNNHCIFCFIDQLPKGLRKSLYIKDEDFCQSFLNGNYITLTSITQKDINKIIRLKLSPLYISVHSTDPDIRRKMLGNNKAGNILKQLKQLESNNIYFHTQIVICPDINNGTILEKTIHDLLAFKDGLLSIAVVPVGLTQFRKKYIKPVSKEEARSICKMVNILGEEDRKNIGFRRLFISDELLLKAGLDIPGYSYYENFPQIENGVGLVRQLLEEWKNSKNKLLERKKNIDMHSKLFSYPISMNCLMLTSESAVPFLKNIVKELAVYLNGFDITVAPVPNRFFGESVTVAGLISANDIIHTVRKTAQNWDVVIIPSVVLNYRGYTLDGFSVKRIAKKLGFRVENVNNISHLVNLLLEDRRCRMERIRVR